MMNEEDLKKVVDSITLPDPGTQEWDQMVDNMRYLDTHMGVIQSAQEIIENKRECLECGEIWQTNKDSTGYCEVCGSANIQCFDFDQEFEKWKEKNK